MTLLWELRLAQKHPVATLQKTLPCSFPLVWSFPGWTAGVLWVGGLSGAALALLRTGTMVI